MQLAAHQSELGAQVSILTNAEAELPSWWNEWRSGLPQPCNLELIPIPPRSLRTLLGVLRAARAQNDILHIHGVWGKTAWSAMQLDRHGGAPTILAPHGTLSAWSLRQKPLKKALALAVSWRRSLMRVDALHALNDAECSEVERELPGARVEILPNGVNLEEFAPASQPVDELLAPLTGGRSYFLFLARLHHVKGPDRLLRAFALAVRSNLPPEVDLVMAGPDYGMLEMLRGLAQDLGVSSRVRFVGPVRGMLKIALLRHALCLCQPSLYECFSITVLESLACGVPVLITPESNFPEVAAHGAGMVVEGAPEQLSGALARLALEPQTSATMGAAGLDLVGRQFTWTAVAERSLHAYERLRAARAAVAAKRVIA